jgi:hypothetical protein
MASITVEDLQKQIVSALRKGNEVTAEKIKAAVEAVRSGKIPAPRISETTFNATKFREDAVAYAGKLPAPADVVESAFDFADRVVAEQRKFADRVVTEQRKFAGQVKKATVGALRSAEDKLEDKPEVE